VNKDASFNQKLTLAIVSAIAAILVAVQKNLGLAVLAERHRAAGSSWQRVVSKAAVTLAYTHEEQRVRASVEDLEALIDDIVAKSPQIPERRFKEAGLETIYAELEQHASAGSRPDSP
jgi:hypothetical protein